MKDTNFSYPNFKGATLIVASTIIAFLAIVIDLAIGFTNTNNKILVISLLISILMLIFFARRSDKLIYEQYVDPLGVDKKLEDIGLKFNEIISNIQNGNFDGEDIGFPNRYDIKYIGKNKLVFKIDGIIFKIKKLDYTYKVNFIEKNDSITKKYFLYIRNYQSSFPNGKYTLRGSYHEIYSNLKEIDKLLLDKITKTKRDGIENILNDIYINIGFLQENNKLKLEYNRKKITIKLIEDIYNDNNAFNIKSITINKNIVFNNGWCTNINREKKLNILIYIIKALDKKNESLNKVKKFSIIAHNIEKEQLLKRVSAIKGCLKNPEQNCFGFFFLLKI